MHKNLFAQQTWNVLEKLALIFLYNFHREHGLIKLIRKKFIAEIQCEKHKKSSLSPTHRRAIKEESKVVNRDWVASFNAII